MAVSIPEFGLIERTHFNDGSRRRVTRSYRAPIRRVSNVAWGNVVAVELLKFLFGKFVEVHSNDILQTAGSLSLSHSSERPRPGGDAVRRFRQIQGGEVRPIFPCPLHHCDQK